VLGLESPNCVRETPAKHKRGVGKSSQ